MKYTINLFGLIFLAVAALFICGVTPVAGLNQPETILTGLVLICFSDTLSLTLESKAGWVKCVVWAFLPATFALLAYAFATLLGA